MKPAPPKKFSDVDVARVRRMLELGASHKEIQAIIPMGSGQISLVKSGAIRRAKVNV